MPPPMSINDSVLEYPNASSFIVIDAFVNAQYLQEREQHTHSAR